MRLRCLAVWLATTLWPPSALAADGPAYVFVANQEAATVSVIDTAPDEIAATISVAFAPASIAVDRDGTTLYVTHPERGEISVIDAGKREVVRSLKVSGTPFGIAVSQELLAAG